MSTPAPITCFMIEETSRRWHSFSRFEMGACPSNGESHYACTYADDIDSADVGTPDFPEEGDPRIPTSCTCGHAFGPNTTSTSAGIWYRDPRDGSMFPQLGGAPPGAMWFAPYLLEGKWSLSPEYMADHLGKRPPLVVMLPDRGSWCVDEKARWNGVMQDHGWRVTGEAPLITASPSIRTTRYHGFLRNGVLEPCSDSKC